MERRNEERKKGLRMKGTQKERTLRNEGMEDERRT